MQYLINARRSFYQIPRTFNGNEKWFEKSEVQGIEGGIIGI